MALLEMGANVQTNGCPSRFYSARNFIFGTEGNNWTSSNGKGKLINDCHHHYSLSVPSPTHILGYDKELVKQTILKHEAMFKDQIHELHRLYRKQRELMDELRRNELYKHNNLRIEISWSGALSHVSSENAPKGCCSPKLALAAGESSVLVAESTLLPLGSVQEKIRQLCIDPGPGVSLVGGLLKDPKPSNCNYKKVGKKILDLELPADEYIDCEEGDSVEDERVSRVAEVSVYTSNVVDADKIFSQCEALNKKPEHVNDLPGFRSSDQINLGTWSKEKNSVDKIPLGTQGPSRDGLVPGPSSAQPVSEGVEDPKNTNLNVTPAVCSETMAFQSIWVNDKQNKFQDSRQGLPWLLEKPVPKRQLDGEDSKISTQQEPVILKHYLGGIHGFEIKKVGGSDLCKDKILVIPVNGKPCTPFDLPSSHASPSNICQIQSDNQKIEEIGRDCVLSVNSSCNLPDLGGQMPGGDKKNEHDKKRNCLTRIIDLNSCLNEDVDIPVDDHFQAPQSLQQNSECSPARGESDEKQLEMPYQFSGQEDPQGQEHEVRIAAEALVSISAFVVPNDPQMTDFRPSESSRDGPLHWFAKIVSSIKDHPKNEAKVDCNGKTADDLEEFLPAGIDYFEAMTLKLTEAENLDCCCNKITDQNGKEGGSSLSHPRKGQATKRGRRQRNFRSEILPSVAALSRCEVTEDLQIIEGLMDAAGTHLETVSLRSAGRGRKRSRTLASKVSDSLLKHLTDDTDLRIEKRGLLVSWERTCKKRRGHRYPTSNPEFFSRVCI
ncbi:uncharacterized protein LOC114721831 isoform X2 [Neltuma alba]|uniref:uncharacterized protein LOC114721831 isoform X2 n=1 Tax=Neltuma alba TaxID=207710 RepID=UPI0010A35E35|nr:uncharacterized protein LOC114721831 isoform X2 [Prosopis alba]